MEEAEKPVVKPATKPAAKVAAKPVPAKTAPCGLHGVEVEYDHSGRLVVRAKFLRDDTVPCDSGAIRVRRAEGVTPYIVITGAKLAEVRTGVVIKGEIAAWYPRLPASGEVVLEGIYTRMGELIVVCRAFGLGTATLLEDTILATVEVTK